MPTPARPSGAYPRRTRHAVRVQLPAHSRAVGQARTAAADFLSRQAVPDGLDCDDVLLAVSELVTNSVKAGAQSVTLELTLSAGRFTVVVEDDAGGWPAAQRASEDSERGRGLAIVARLADDWKVEQTSVGKQVVAVFKT